MLYSSSEESFKVLDELSHVRPVRIRVPTAHSKDLSKIRVRGYHDDSPSGLGCDGCASSGRSDTETGGDYAFSEPSIPRGHHEIG